MNMEEEQADWRRKSTFNREQQQVFNRLLFAFILLAIGILIGWVIFSNNIDGYNVNLYTNLLSIGLTVGIIEYLNQHRAKKQLKAQLIREMASADNGIALRAVRELSDQGWIKDGSLQGAYLASANLRRAPLTGANLSEASCISTNFEEADMWNTNLNRATAASANFRKAHLNCADLVDFYGGMQCLFQETQLVEVDLSRANLARADFTNADLNNSNLRDCDLNNANLSGANLTNANLQGAKLEGAILTESTRLPDGELVSNANNKNLERFTDPNRDDFWRPIDGTDVWWTEKGRPRVKVEVSTFYKSWQPSDD